MSSEAEDKFRAVVLQAIYDVTIAATAVGANVVHIEDYADAVVGSLKLDQWFIRFGEIREVIDSEFIDSNYNWNAYTVWTKMEEEDE